MPNISQLNTFAVELREKWDLNSVSSLDLFSIVQSKMPNLTILFYPMSSSTSGMCIREDPTQIVGINSNMSKGRQRFTLAHELYHLLYQNGFDNLIICDKSNRDEISEKEADNFASRLLMPEEALKRFEEVNHITNWGLDEIISAEQYFQISHFAMLVRLKYKNKLSQSDFNNFRNVSISYESRIRGYEDELYYPSPKSKEYYSIGNYIRLIEKAKSLGKISKGKEKELLLNGFRGDIAFKQFEDDSFEE